MDQIEFDNILCALVSETDINKIESVSQKLVDLSRCSEIRDLTWINDNGEYDLYSGIWKQLYNCLMSPKYSESKVEVNLLEIWQYLVTLPEYNHDVAINSKFITQKFSELLLERIVYISQKDLTKEKQLRMILSYLKKLTHWIYSKHHNYRINIRIKLGKLLLLSECTKGSNVDAGNCRSHIAPLLEIMYYIISGMKTNENTKDSYNHILKELLLPLHKPNEMILWRDQVPVLQLYHEILVKCLLKLVEKDREYINNNINNNEKERIHYENSSNNSILILTIQGVLKTWPDRFDTNTPKQVLLLHELEMLLEKATLKEWCFLKNIVLSRLVRCIGTDADNIRPAQRALQWFKNSRILDLFIGNSKNQTANSDNNSSSNSGSTTADAKSTVSAADITSSSVVVRETLLQLLPALFRSGGGLSWNPTVNKMTGLALKNIQERDPALFEQCCNELFSTTSSSGRMTLSFKPSMQSTATVAAAPKRDASAIAAALDSGHKSTEHSDSTSSSSNTQDGMTWAMGSSTASEGKTDASSDAKTPSTGFPVPSGRLNKPPMMRPPSHKPTTSTTAVSGESKDSLPLSMMRGFSRDNPPPVTVTGVAPWAVKPTPGGSTSSSTGSIHSTGVTHPLSGGSANTGGIPTTTMPKRTPLPFNPATTAVGSRSTTAAMLSNAPPNALTHTIQEVRLARQLAEQQQADQDDATAGSKDSSEGAMVQDGYLRMIAYIERCIPNTAPRTAEEAEAARLADWQTIQAAATPTLLPSLKFHDLVFGSVLGEGAFSTVKYARHITKDKTQSEWPEYAVKIIQASKIIALQYRSSILREMGILQLLSHPGVSRLISAFRYSDSAYMILEYAARGDLHSYLLKYGKLAHKYTRFVLGEVLAGLHYIHELGFSYGDLKPENILITQLGHIKLTDFGACRAVSEEAVGLLHRSTQALETMRNGDWKEEQEPTGSMLQQSAWLQALGSSGGGDSSSAEQTVEEGAGSTSAMQDQAEDSRLEGTPAYLPPEVLRQQVAQPGIAADAWALGCLAYFCLQGRPKYYGDNDQVLAQIQSEWDDTSTITPTAAGVHFTESSADTPQSDTVAILQLQDTASLDFIAVLNSSDRRERWTVTQALCHPYLTHGVLSQDKLHLQAMRERGGAGQGVQAEELPTEMSPLSLHMGPPVELPVSNLREGDLADQQWSRRQFSVLWAPMPSEYQQGDDDAAQSKTGAGGAAGFYAADVWLMTHPYLLTAVEETETEHCSPFV